MFRARRSAFFNRRLDIYLELDEHAQDNDEPFALDNLQQYHLKGQQFEVALEGRSLPELFKDIKATGELPLSEFAPLAFNRDLQAMVDLADITAGYFIGEMETVIVDLQF